MSFLSDYFGIVDTTEETAVHCPFPHHTESGIEYQETNPSAHVNLTNGLFHCKACGAGHNETAFMQVILGCDFIFAKKLQRCFDNTEDIFEWEKNTQITTEGHTVINTFGISDAVIQELHIKNTEANSIQFPVLMYNHLVDIRKYNPGGHPKVKSRAGCPMGLIVPFDVWRTSPKTRKTIICAGEKDMAVARSNGFNAITITGGEQTSVKILSEFKDRDVVIVYDNDGAGKQGAVRLANTLYGVARSVKVCTAFHEVCKENKEDITDFFVKYGKTRNDLIAYIEQTPEYVPTAETLNKTYPTVNLLQASRSDYINRLVQSNIQVVASCESSFVTPTAIIAEKFKLAGQGDTMQERQCKSWEMEDNNIEDVLHLIDNNFKEETIAANIRNLLKIPQKEHYVSVKHYAKKTVFKCYVTDMFETTSIDVIPMEYTAYSIDLKLESGKKYLVTYKLVPHPYKGQQLTMIIVGATQANDSISNFKVTDTAKEHLKVFQNITGSISEKIDKLTEKVKGLLGYNGNNTLIQTMDLAYHTVLQFNFGTFKNVRGYLDTLIVGESRVGKSSTADALRGTYELGVFTSLAGNSATIPGLIGGSNKTAGGAYQTRAGIIPQNHRGLIIFEEFGKSNNNVITELTDIRSSNEVRITRVSGTISMPAMVRMITLTNVKTSDGQIRSIASYPNGIAIITELVGTAEDIARYDMLVVLPDRGTTVIDPLWEPDVPLDKEVYQTRLRWIWSRTPEQIVIPRDVMLYIMDKTNTLNATYDTHIKIFGTEAWKKITRLAIAVAGYVVSADDSYENIVVTEECVDYATAFYTRLYDNPTFKLKEYVEHERRFSTIDEAGVASLQDIYNAQPTLVLQLEQCATTSKNMLGAATGLNNDDLNRMLTMLTRGLFIRFTNHEIIPTERFRLGMSQINRNTRVLRVGEHNV